MFEIIPLNKDNFAAFLGLLQQRGEAPEAFYNYKYLQQKHTFFPTGFIAYLDNIAVGCIGNINKIYIDNEGFEHQATWFADWFVSDSARGKGIGKTLMSQVLNLSPFAFGVPGPENAQTVAENVGYKIQENFYEVLVPCKPFRYGFRKNKSNIFRNLLRGMKHFSINETISKLDEVFVEEISKNDIFDFNNIKNSFKIDSESLQWLMNFPEREGNLRKWYKVKFNNNWLILFVENDVNLNKRARIVSVSLNNDSDYIGFMKIIRYKLSLHNILYFQTYFFSNQKPDFVSEYIKQVPQSCAFELSNNFTISISDFESRWRDFNYS
jgi:GNAT superfamily N-acetyltransferase